MSKWLVMTYRIPREPTAGRVYVWRKMKQLGAVAVQDAVWVLPATTRTQEQFQWLATEITELGGEATYWTADIVYESGDQSLRQQFEMPVEKAYRAILGALKRKDRDLAALSKRYQVILAQDYFQTELGQRVREKLLTARDRSAK
jgi:Protein ChrB, N-terminal